MIIGEGSTDYMHLKKAFKVLKRSGDFQQLNLEFFKPNKKRIKKKEKRYSGCDSLRGIWGTIDTYKQITSTPIFIIDRENENENSEIHEKHKALWMPLPKKCGTGDKFSIESLHAKETFNRFLFNVEQLQQNKDNKKECNQKKLDFSIKVYNELDDPKAFKKFKILFKEIEKKLKKDRKKARTHQE